MAYSVANPPKLLAGGLGGGQPSLWVYVSTDVHTDVDATDYFTNGAALGLKVGDFMLVGKSTSTIGATLHYVQTVTAGGAATIAAAVLA